MYFILPLKKKVIKINKFLILPISGVYHMKHLRYIYINPDTCVYEMLIAG